MEHEIFKCLGWKLTFFSTSEIALFLIRLFRYSERRILTGVPPEYLQITQDLARESLMNAQCQGADYLEIAVASSIAALDILDQRRTSNKFAVWSQSIFTFRVVGLSLHQG